MWAAIELLISWFSNFSVSVAVVIFLLTLYFFLHFCSEKMQPFLIKRILHFDIKIYFLFLQYVYIYIYGASSLEVSICSIFLNDRKSQGRFYEILFFSFTLLYPKFSHFLRQALFFKRGLQNVKPTILIG